MDIFYADTIYIDCNPKPDSTDSKYWVAVSKHKPAVFDNDKYSADLQLWLTYLLSIPISKKMEIIPPIDWISGRTVVAGIDYQERPLTAQRFLNQLNRTLNQEQQEEVGYCLDSDGKKDAEFRAEKYKIPTHNTTKGIYVHHDGVYYIFNDFGHFIGHTASGVYVKELRYYAVPITKYVGTNSVRDKFCTGSFSIGEDGQREPADWKSYALKLETYIKSLNHG